MSVQDKNLVSYTVREIELPVPARSRYNIRLYYNRLEPRHREKLPHSHLAMEIDMFGGGCKGTYVIGDRTYAIRDGDIFILRSNEEHSIVHMEEGESEKCVCTGIQFSPDFLWSPSSELGDMSNIYEVFLGLDSDFCHKLDAGQPVTRIIKRELEDIVWEFNQAPVEYSLMVKVKLISVLILLAREYRANRRSLPGQHIQKEKRVLIENALNFIDSHLMEPITLESVAGHVHMSPSYLSLLFKSLNGFTTWEYIVAQRIECAKKLLLESNELVIDICMKSGFNSITNFNRAFKREVGMSPKEYRRRMRL